MLPLGPVDGGIFESILPVAALVRDPLRDHRKSPKMVWVLGAEPRGGIAMRAIWSTVLACACLAMGGAPSSMPESGPADEPPKGSRSEPARPYLVLGGRISRYHQAKPMQCYVDCYVPGRRSAEEVRLLRVDESSLLLRAGAGGRFSRIELADLYKGDKLDFFQAVVAREPDPSDRSHLVHWLVMYSSREDRPIQNEPSR
jgi:hypothetical protein